MALLKNTGNLIRRVSKRASRFLKNLYFLVFCNGLLIGSMVYCYNEDQYEKDLFRILGGQAIAQLGGSKDMTEDSLIIQCMRFTHDLEMPRNQYFSNSTLQSFKANFIQPVTFHLMTAQGSCGSYSLVLGRMLKELNFDVRFPQMKVNGVYGAHIILEVRAPHGWVVLDPFYELYFTRPDGKLASFADVQANWEYYRKQVPAGYNKDFNYNDVRYTNWDKIPVLMPATKKVLDFLVGKECADKVSMRNLILRKFKFIMLVILGIYIPLTIFTLYRLGKTPKGKHVLQSFRVQRSPIAREAVR